MRDIDSRKRIEEKIRRELGEEIHEQLNDPQTIEIILNPDGILWVEKLGGRMKAFSSMNASLAESLICSVASYLGTEINQQSPILECEFPLDGSRFEAILPPVVTAPAFALRRQAIKFPQLSDYVRDEIMSPKQEAHLVEAIAARKNILVVGGTGTGKTTLANAILARIAEITPDHRLVVIEDTREIRCASRNVVMLRSTPEISQTKLLRATLRLTPDRIAVGEVRGGEALDLLKAWNTGHSGGVSTIHANGALAALSRLEQLVAEAIERPMQSLIAEAVNLIVVIQKMPEGRKVTELVEIHGFDGRSYTSSHLE